MTTDDAGFALVELRPPERFMDLNTFARAAGAHPELVRRLVALGLLDARRDPAGELWFPVSQVAAFGRIQRLRAGFSLNYAAVGLVVDLLDRIADLEVTVRRVRRIPSRQGG